MTLQRCDNCDKWFMLNDEIGSGDCPIIADEIELYDVTNGKRIDTIETFRENWCPYWDGDLELYDLPNVAETTPTAGD